MTKRSSKSTTKKKPKRKKGKKTDEERNHENPDESPLETDEEGEVESDLESESEKSEEKRADSSAPNEQRNILKLDEPPSKKSELGRGTDECVPSKSEEMKYNSKRKISKEERKSVSSEPKKKKKNSKEIPNCHNDKEGCKTNQHSCDNKEQQQFSNNIEENSVSNELPKKKRKRTKKVPDASGASSSGASSSGASSSRVSSSGDPINTPTVNYKEGSKTYQHSSQNEEQQQFSNSSEEREKRSVKKQVFGSNETTSGNASYSFTNVFTAHTIRNDQEEKTDDTLLRRSLRSRTNVTNHPLNEEWFAERNNPNYANAAKKSNLGYEHTFRDSSSNSSKPKLLKESSSSNPCFVDISTEGKIVVRINFLVAVPSKLIDDSDMLVVICGHRDLGRWEQPLVALHQIRNAMESFGIYSAKLNVPEELLKYPLQYKYLVLNTNGIKFWEVLNRREYEENRVLSFKSLKGCTKHRHYQFDDIFIPQKGIGGKIMSYISSFFKNQDPFSHLPDVFEFYANKIMEANPNLKPYLIFCLYKSFFDASSHTHDRQKSWKKLEDLKIFEDTIKIYLARMKSVMVNDTAFNIQDQDRIKQFADVLLMLSGLVNCDIRMDALVVPICDILSLNGFCCSNILLKDALQSILEDHIELVCSGLKSLWEIIRRSRSIDIGEKWIHPLVLIHLLDERNDVLKDFERLDARHVKSVINNAEIVRKSLEMDQALQKMICFSMDQENFAFALKTGCFNKSFVMEAMINCITEKNTDYFTDGYLCNALDVYLNADDIKVSEEEFYLLLEMMRCAQNTLKISRHPEFYLKLCKIIQLQNIKSYSENMIEYYDNFIHAIANSIRYTMESFHTPCEILNQMLVFNVFITWKVEGDESSYVQQESCEAFSEYVSKMTNAITYIQCYNKLCLTDWCDEIRKILFNHMEVIFRKQLSANEVVITSIAVPSNTSKFFYHHVQNIWNNIGSSNTPILSEIFKRTSIYHFLTNLDKVQDEELKKLATEIFTVIKHLVELVMSDMLEIKNIKLIVNKKHWFVTVCQSLFKFAGVDLNVSDLRRKIESFEAYWKRFNLELQSIKSFVHFIKRKRCGDVTTLEERLETNMDDIPIKDCLDQTYLVNIFSLEQMDIDTLKKLFECDIFNFEIFQNKWEEMKQQKSKADDYLDVINSLQPLLYEILYPTIHSLGEWVKKLFSGNIDAAKIKNIFKHRNMSTLKKELNSYNTYFDLKYTLLDMLLRKFECLRTLDQVTDLAGDILETSKTLQFKGDFNTISEIYAKRDSVDDLQLIDIDEETIKHSNMLGDITDTQKRFLDTVSKCLNLVIWVRDELKDRNELKKFVDFISNSGETSFEVQRVKCFDLACKGLEILIFDTNETSGFEDLVKACSINLRGQENTDEFFQAIIDTNRYLEWFKRSYESLGSVVETAFMKAQDINRRGYYIIGLEMQEYLDKIDLKDFVIKLVLPDEDDNRFDDGLNVITENDKKFIIAENIGKIYQTEDIDNLQSLLILLGDSKMDESKVSERDYFIKICNIMKDLANVFVDLIEVGCLEMFDFQYVFRCDINDPSLKYSIDKVENLSHEYDEQKNKIEIARLEEPLLNFFSIKQCVVLQKYLADLLSGRQNKLSYQAINLLASISNDIDENKIEEHVQFLFGKGLSRSHPTRKEDNNDDIIDDFFKSMKKSDIEEIVDELIENGASEEQAYAALMAVRPFEKSEALIWCIEEADEIDDYEIEELSRKVKTFLEEMELSNENDGSTIAAEEQETKITFLSLEQLVYFLKIHSKGNYSQTQIADLFESKPYLFTVEKDEIIETVLHLYYESFRKLPNLNNVLYCTKDTTLEEVELIVRKAMSNSNEIFSLMFIEELDFRITKKAVEFIQEKLHFGIKRPLLLFCSNEKEYNNLFVSSFAVYHATLPLKIDSDVVHKNLKKCLVTDKMSNEVVAYDIAPERSICSVVSSNVSGMGKSFQVKQKAKQLRQALIDSNPQLGNTLTKVSIPIHGNQVNVDEITTLLLEYEEKAEYYHPKIYHFDISPTVEIGVESFLFNLVVLGAIQNKNGVLWRKKKCDAVIIEVTLSEAFRQLHLSKILEMLPQLKCNPPSGCLEDSQMEGETLNDEIFRSEAYQRVYQYLAAFDAGQDLNDVAYSARTYGNKRHCLETLIRHCGIKDPSWIEVNNFVKFFNQQLQDCEESNFCNNTIPVNQEIINGFKSFVVKFCLEMSKDFATRSVNSEEQKRSSNDGMVELKRKWENSIHPYLFFNHDHSSFSFVGFNIDRNGNLLDPNNGTVVLRNVMTPALYQGLSLQLDMERNYINFSTRFNELSKAIKLTLLCRVMGIEYFNGIDPDPSFVLTSDNVQKILAIHMRLRANIPVIMSGETGCGKTKLIKYMTSLLASGKPNVQNLVLAKIHGGTTFAKLRDYLGQAIEIAKNNITQIKGGIDTILFFDECNTSEAVGLIKEIMMDSSCFGKPVDFEECRLKIVAAINPYRRHTSHMIKKLECSGLGYYNENDEELEKLGKIPLRQLVYRVHILPDSLKSIVWDYGQLNEDSERAYIEKIVSKEELLLPQQSQQKNIVDLLVYSQNYMRKQKDECSFVSLRDVERAIKVLRWFRKKIRFFEDIKLKSTDEIFKIITLLTLSVCYISRLENRTQFLLNIPGGYTEKDISYIEKIQRNIAKKMVLEKNIALNKALCENIFMMLVCIELRIPLFVVGKPGSSKSLAKTIIQESLQGKLSKSEFCHYFKQIFMASYQCSVLSTAEGIISTFRQCSEYQQGKDLDHFASVVVLDEVGLAEDSPKMPLKALHPLLEDGTDCSEDLAIDERKKNLERPAFIGLSNFAIDPAKMNRGIMLSHPTPDLKQLYETASELCEGDQFVKNMLDDFLKMLAKGYLNVYEQQKNNRQLNECKKLEFFGLRDYYSLVKEIFCMSKQVGDVPSVQNIKIAIQRNFSGLENFDSWLIFAKELSDLIIKKLNELGDDVLPIDLIEHSLRRQCQCYEERSDDEKSSLSKCYNSRYLLLLTEEFAALDVVQNILFKNNENVDIIFGSSFPKDQEFTQVYRDITHIKMCMETGRTVVLLNMENLYESLYDALNQYYVYFGGQKYVDLGLGVHRVKCRVHNDFRLIVIADVNTVYKAFPIPLINRLEKHFVLPSLNMSQDQQQLSEKLNDWAKSFSAAGNNNRNASQAFPGFNQSTSLAIISKFGDNYSGNEEEVLKASKKHLIQAATPDAIIRYSDTKTSEAQKFFNEYLTDSRHFSLVDYINWVENSLLYCNDVFSQITTFSRLLAENDVNDERIHLLHLKEFQTKSGFEERLKRVIESLHENSETNNFIVIQCTNVQENQNLVNCAKHICGEFHKNEAMNLDCPLFFIFILQLNHSSMELKSWQAHWTTIHIDELKTNNSAIIKFYNKKLSEMFDNEDKNIEEILQITSSCIQSSVKDLNDQNKMDNNSIKQKINILKTLLTDYQVGFSHHLFGFIKSGLHDREKYGYTDGQEKICADWVRKQAKKQCEKANYSTFNKSLTHTIEESVRPLLTGFLTKCDVNSNLLLINSDSGNTNEIWMTLFEQEIYNIQGKYSKVEGYKCLFPFSTNLVSLVDDEFSNTEENIVERVMKIENALNQRFNSFDISREEQSNYINDFLHMKISELCHPEILQILGKALHHQVEVLLRNNDISTSNVSMNIFIACVKLLFDQYESRFNCAAKIASLKKTDLQNVDVCYDDREMTADVILLEKFFQSVWPDKRFHLLSGNKGYEWTISLKKLKPLMISMCELNKKKEFSEIACEIFNQQRLKWTKLRIFQLFIEVVVKDFKSFHQQGVTDFFKAIEKLEDNLESENSWQAIHAAIDNSMQVSESYEENEEKFLQKRFATFYIDLVSEFSFNRFDCLQVEDDVIDMLMGQVFSIDKTKTKMFSPIRDYKLDESYTIRSFLLKQLFRMKKGKQLNQFLEDNLTAVSQQEDCAEDYWMICNLFLFTCEDHITIQKSHLEKIQQQRFITHVVTLLEQALPNIIHSSDINAKTLTSIAEARYALTIACNYLCQFYVHETLDETLTIPLERLFNAMEGFCNESEAHYFCLRYIMKTYGMNEYKKIVEISGFTWLELQKDEEGDFEQDMFLVYGNAYKEVRDQLQDAIVEGRTLSSFLEENGDIPENIRTMCFLKEILFGSLDQEIKEKFCDITQVQQFIHQFDRTVDQANAALKDLLIHFETLQNSNNFATEIIRIFNTSPQLIRNLYLPAMPSDHFEEIRNVQGGNEAWVMHECPNGHPYVITNCGNPYQSYNCNICNARIGAATAGNHALAANNRAAQARDLTRRGYCVGNAVERSPDGTTERHLKSSSVVLQRFVIHLSLYRLALVDHQSAIGCITLPVGVTDARRFFEEHLQADINILSKKFAMNSNDVNILLHMFLQHLQTVTLQHQGDLVQLLETKPGRGNYEDTFDRDVIAPFLQGYQKELPLVQTTILNDMDKSRDPKFRKLHQLSVQHIPEINGVELLNNWKIWQIHKPISYSHFLQYVEQLDNQNNSVECKTLQSFLQQEEQFELIQNLPYLVRFQKLLFAKFNYKYSKNTIEDMKAKDAEKEFSGNEKDEFKNLLSKFCSTWNSVSKYLQHHRRFRLEDDECPKILKSTSSFAYFICSTSGPGRCAIALIDYLAFLQHDFIDVWKTSDVMKFNVFNKVNLMAINEADVISYSRDKDFIPLLYGQCNYAVEVGQAMKIDYDLESIEKQLVEKVFFGASLIDIVIETFVYLDDVRTTEKFNKFSKSIPQEQISKQDEKQICLELGDITDLTNSLKAVEISIGFLSVTHGENDMKFKNYVENILQMDIDVYIKSPRLRSIQLRHLISVWLSLTVESCLRLHKSKKIAFEIDERFRVDLDTKTKVKIKSQLQHHRVKPLIDLLTEYIVFKLNDAPDLDFGLFETLQAYEDQTQKDEKIIDDEMVDLPVLVKHTYFMWKVLADVLQE